jgi:hypothetical protein
MSARILALVGMVAAATSLTGCSSTKRVYSAEREDGRVTSLDWRIGEKIEASRWDRRSESDPPPLAANEAISVASGALGDFVENTGQWSLAYCRLVEFQPGCYGYAVRFDRKGAFDEAQASGRFVKLYVLFNKSVLVPTVAYDR